MTHDFFADRFVRAGNLADFLSSMRAKARSWVGGILGVNQSDVRGGNVVSRRAKPTGAKRLTGADDVWDPASSLASLRGMPRDTRLDSANAATGIYVRGPDPTPPTFEVMAELA